MVLENLKNWQNALSKKGAAYYVAATCIMAFGDLLPWIVQASFDVFQNTILYGTIPISRWWVIPAVELTALIAAIIVNLAYWETEEILESATCPNSVAVSANYAILGTLLAFFPRAPFFTTINILAFGVLYLTSVGTSFRTGKEEQELATVGLILSFFIPFVLGVQALLVPKGAFIQPIIDIVSLDAFVQMFRSIIGVIFLVPAVAFITQNLMTGTAKEAGLLELVNRFAGSIGIGPDQYFDVQFINETVIWKSAFLGGLINIAFYNIVLGEPLYILPGLTFSSQFTPLSGTIASAGIGLFLVTIGVSSAKFRK